MFPYFRRISWPPKTKFIVLLAAIAFILLTFFFYQINGVGFEWGKIYRPATLELISARSPYSFGLLLTPPWLLIPLIPLALLPEKLGSALLCSIGLAAFSTLGIKMGAKPITLAFIILSYPVSLCLYRGQIDWLPLLGFLLPPQYGLFLVTAKPQLGVAIAIFWLVEAWRKGGLRQAVKVFAPVCLAYLLSFVIYGFWPLENSFNIQDPLQVSLWPYSIPIGLAFLFLAIRSRKANLSMAASPFLSPYVQAYSWSGALFGLLPYQAVTIVAVIGVWVWQLIRVFH
jgi:hypothetical protein